MSIFVLYFTPFKPCFSQQCQQLLHVMLQPAGHGLPAVNESRCWVKKEACCYVMGAQGWDVAPQFVAAQSSS